MRRLIGIPVYDMSCRVRVDKGRAWSVVDEVILWASSQEPRSIEQLTADSDLPRSLIVASIARMMRFRLLEVTLANGHAAFQPSRLAAGLVGKPIPYVREQISRRVRFVIDRATGSLLRRRGLHLVLPDTLEDERKRGTDVRLVTVHGGSPPMSAEANLQRLAKIAVRNPDEQLEGVDSRTTWCRDEYVMAIDVVDGVAGIPRDTPAPLSDLVARLAHERKSGDVSVPYSGPVESTPTPSPKVACDVQSKDVLVGGEEHEAALRGLIEGAERRMVIHSTFLAVDKFEALIDDFRDACSRGVTFDILWGAASDEDTLARNATAAASIVGLIRDDPDLAGRMRVHMTTTGSHAKLLLCDGAEGGWVAVVGSCNWLRSPFQTVEISAVLREQRVVAEVAKALYQLLGRRGMIFEALVSELGMLSRVLEAAPAPPTTNGFARVVVGQQHEEVARVASGEAKQRLVIGSHRLGATARPGALLQASLAVAKAGVEALVIYTMPSGPLDKNDARALEDEMRAAGVTLVRAQPPRLHGKFVLWDDDDIIITSFNWASASVEPDSPYAELGVHLHAPSLAADVMSRLRALLPRLSASPVTEYQVR